MHDFYKSNCHEFCIVRKLRGQHSNCKYILYGISNEGIGAFKLSIFLLSLGNNSFIQLKEKGNWKGFEYVERLVIHFRCFDSEEGFIHGHRLLMSPSNINS